MMTRTTNHTKSGFSFYQRRREEIAHRLRQVVDPVSSDDSFWRPIGSQTDPLELSVSEATNEFPWDAGKRLELFWNGSAWQQIGLALPNITILTLAHTSPLDNEPSSAGTHSTPKRHRPIWKIAEDIANEHPEIWYELPKDSARNLDHYLYGHPKKGRQE